MNFFMLALLLPVIILIWKGIRIVPQGEEWVVERLGKFSSVLNPGLHVINPIFSKVSYKVTTKDIILEIPEQVVIT
jgi:regulator of protease activity HflC (stomatin/prohibitin superfamily)